MIFDGSDHQFRIRAESVPRFDAPVEILPEDIPDVFDTLASGFGPQKLDHLPVPLIRKQMPMLRRLYPNVFRGLRTSVTMTNLKDVDLLDFARLSGALDGRLAEEASRRSLLEAEDLRLRSTGPLPGRALSRALRDTKGHNRTGELFRSKTVPGFFQNERHIKEPRHKPVLKKSLAPAPALQQREQFRLHDKAPEPRAGGLHVARDYVEWTIPRRALERRHHGGFDGPPARDSMLSSPHFEVLGEACMLRLWPDGRPSRMFNPDSYQVEKQGWCTLGLFILHPGSHLRIRFFIGSRDNPFASSQPRNVYSDSAIVWPGQFFEPPFPRPNLKDITDEDDNLLFSVEITRNFRNNDKFMRRKFQVTQ